MKARPSHWQPIGCAATAGTSDWLATPAPCQELRISRSTLSRWRQRGLLRSGHHWARKNPACPRSDLLWHGQRCQAALGSSAREGSAQQSCRCPQTPTGN
jgi:hypothetical protein